MLGCDGGTLLARSDLDTPSRIDLAFRRAYGRPAIRREIDRAADYLGRFRAGWPRKAIPRESRPRAPGNCSVRPSSRPVSFSISIESIEPRITRGWMIMDHHWNAIDVPVMSRRDLLRQVGGGFASLALDGLLAEESRAASHIDPRNPLAPRPGHFPARAKRVIFLFMHGGPSQVDTFDYKPLLERDHGKPCRSPSRASCRARPGTCSGLHSVSRGTARAGSRSASCSPIWPAAWTTSA